MSNIQYITKVIRSCKNIEQLETCENWLKTATRNVKGDSCVDFISLLDLKNEIIGMREYITRLKAEE